MAKPRRIQVVESVIETERLRLRLPVAADVPALMAIHEDPHVLKQITTSGNTQGITVAWRNVAMMLGHWTLRGYGQWVVAEKETDLVVGRVGLFNPEGWPGIELGWLIRHSHWGRGYATESASAALDWAWRNVDTDHIISMIAPDNVASIRIATKIGERFERELVMDGITRHVFGVHRRRP